MKEAMVVEVVVEIADQNGEGDASPEFRSALHFVDDFIASAQPAPDPIRRQILQQMLPGIERSLRLGLANVAFQDQDVERLMAQLRTYYRKQLGETLDESEIVMVDEDSAADDKKSKAD